MAHHSVAVALFMMMMFSWSNCMISNKSIASATAGNSTAVASSAWCSGQIIDGQCMLVEDAAAAYGEHLDLDAMDMAEYYDPSEISRRVLVRGLGITQRAVKNPYQSVVPNRIGKYGRQPNSGRMCGSMYNRECPKH